jgi:hypothetical protein
VVEGLDAVHHPDHVLGQRHVAARQLLERSDSGIAAVVDRLQLAAAQQLRQIAGVDVVVLAARLHLGTLPWIADHHVVDVRLQNVVQPVGRNPFLQGDEQLAAEAVDEIKNGGSAGLYYRLHDQLATLVANRNDDGCLVNVKTDILHACHKKGAPCVGEFRRS